MADQQVESLKEEIQDLRNELERLKAEKRSDTAVRSPGDIENEIEEVQEQVHDVVDNSGWSRRDFLKMMGGGAAGLGAAAMLPSLGSAFKVESSNALEYFNRSSDNASFSVTPGGNVTAPQLGEPNDKIQNIHANSLTADELNSKEQVHGGGDESDIQAAIDAMPDSPSKPHVIDVVGDYDITNKITYGSYTWLDLRGAKLTLKSGIGDEPMLEKQSDTEQTAIVGGVLDGNKSNLTGTNTGIEDLGSSGTFPDFRDPRDLLYKVQVRDFTSDGIVIDSRRMLAQGLTVYNCDGWGITTNSSDASCYNCGVHSCGKDGFRVRGSYNVFIHCYSANHTGNGLLSPGGVQGQQIIGGYYENNIDNESGILLNGTRQCLILGVTLIDNEDHGIELTGTSGNDNSHRIIGCEFHDSGTENESIAIADSDVNDVMIAHCDFLDASNKITDSGTDTKVLDCPGLRSTSDFSSTGTRTVLDGKVIAPETLDLGGSDGTVSPTVIGVPIVPFLIDAGGSATELEGIGGSLREEGQTVRVIHTGGENVTLVHNDTAETDPLINQGGANVTLGSNGDMAEYTYSTQASKWIMTGKATTQ